MFDGHEDATFEGKLSCALKNDMRKLENFHRLSNRNFVLEKKVAQRNKKKNSKQPLTGYCVKTSF